MIKIVIFDFDDTIVNNNKLDYQSFMVAFKHVNLPTPSLKKITKLRKGGYLAKDIARIYLKKNNKLSSLSNFLNFRKKFLNSKESILFLCLKKGTRALLHLLKNKNIKILLCSSTNNKNLVICFLKKKKISRFFSNCYFMKNVGLNIKNSSESNRIRIKNRLLQKILKNESTQPNEIIFIGNSKEDLYASENIGINFIYLQNNYLPRIYTNKKLIKIDDIMLVHKKLRKF